MTSERIVLRKAHIKDARQVLGQIVSLGDLPDKEFITVIAALLTVVGRDDDRFSTTVEFPELPGNVIGFLVPNTFVHVNVSRFSLAAAGALLDALYTYGGSSLVLGAAGLLKTSLARLSPDNGEFCARIQADQLNKKGLPITPANAVASVDGKRCPFTHLNCRYMRDEICSASEHDFTEVFHSLEQKGALSKSSGNYSVPI